MPIVPSEHRLSRVVDHNDVVLVVTHNHTIGNRPQNSLALTCLLVDTIKEHSIAERACCHIRNCQHGWFKCSTKGMQSETSEDKYASERIMKDQRREEHT